jgi:hypothetical protein
MTQRIAEISVRSLKSGFSVKWTYFERGTRDSDESEMLGTLLRLCDRMASSADLPSQPTSLMTQPVAAATISLHRVPIDGTGEPGPPSHGFELRPDPRPDEVARPASELLAAARAQLS